MFNKEIKFSAHEDYFAQKEDYPIPIKLNIPEWYKKLDHTLEIKTIKGCMPFLDTLTSGYLLKMPQDFNIKHNVENDKGQKDSFPWTTAEVGYLGTEMLKYTMAIKTDTPDWLKKERTKILRISGIEKKYLNFDINSYRPHISVANFVGAIRDLKYVEEVELELHKHFKDIGEMVLDPLKLKSDLDNWDFRPLPFDIYTDF